MPYDGFGARINVHDINRTYYRGSAVEPWQKCYTCICGADLGFDEQGLGSTDVDLAFEEHLADMEGL